jgi:serine/threonine-protein kinase
VKEGPRALGNRYLLEGPIGRGGMGVVFRARDRQLDREVAVKLVSEEAGPGGRARFLAEARRTAAVRHPSIIEVFDVGEDEGDAYLVMELLVGETLEQRLERETRLAAADAVAIAVEICDALSAAHHAGLVHRDLKPANVFLVQAQEGARRVKLLDFGIAKRIEGATARTDPGMLVGTLESMAPEQIRGDRVDGRADLYALGLTLYRALAGAPAFQGETAASLVHQHLSVRPVALSARVPSCDVPPWLSALVEALLAKEPEARPGSAEDVKRALGGATLPVPAPAAHMTDGLHEGMRMMELDDDASNAQGAVELELDRGAPPPRLTSPPGRAAPSLAPLPQARGPLAPPSRALPPWLAPLAGVPVALSKRVTGYALFALGVYVVFFHAALLPSLALLAVAAAGGVAMWAARREAR